MTIWARLPMVLLLAIAATLELALNRIGVHLLKTQGGRPGAVFRIIDTAGLYSFYLTGVLALFVFTWAVVVLIRDRALLRPADRIVFTVLSALFMPLAATGLLFDLPRQVAPHLNTGFGLMVLALLVAFLRRPATLRPRLGMIYLAAPILLHVYWLACQQIEWVAPTGAYSEVPSQLFVAAEHMVVVGAFAAFFFFAPFPRFSTMVRPLPLIISVLVTAGVALAAQFSYLETAQAAYYGLGLNLPPPSARGVMHLAALFLFVITVVSLSRGLPHQRGIGLGLYLLGISGFHLQLPYQFLLTLVGLMQIARGAIAERMVIEAETVKPAASPSKEQWGAYFTRLGGLLARPEPGETVTLHNEGQQIAYVRGAREGTRFTVRAQHNRGGVRRLEVLLGAPPRHPAPLTLTRRKDSRGGKVAGPSAGSRLRLGDELEGPFSATDTDGMAEGLFDGAELAEGLLRLVHGWIGVWPREGLHYITHPPADGYPLPAAEVAFSPEDASTEELEELLELLQRLARRAGVG